MVDGMAVQTLQVMPPEFDLFPVDKEGLANGEDPEERPLPLEELQRQTIEAIRNQKLQADKNASQQDAGV